MSRTTIHDIARELKTSAATVSRALNDHPSISTATKESIRKAAQRLNYRQNRTASSLRSGKTFVVGVIVPSVQISFFGSVIHGIEQVIKNQGYNVLLFQTNEQYEDEVQGVQTLLQSNVDGIIASISKETIKYDHFLEVKHRNIPLVLFDRSIDELEVPAVVIDDYKGAFMATEHLIQQGYKRIAHISGPQHIRIFHERLRGYVDALKAYGHQVDGDLITYGKLSIDSGRACTQHLLRLAHPPDAIFAVEDFSALGALQVIKESPWSQPGQIGLVGFANEAFSAYITPSLTTIDQQTALMGQEAATIFMNLRQEESNPTGPPQKIVLEPTLVVRQSSLKRQETID
ncbi:LacI family DNA-binding transcriptional regulator [Rufibacter glacialis]|uniref:LacI family DNA-binding transcriptional regulator n=1 Tax=Rufibacter glacialis TaxID=1259555 RepID=A0A5M8Q2N9_9BACT|nr:LacI family DNA-binding transcriptional regulator [Rufibacter glacialis]KAA6430175.1 LacI family transcriptional regulator [Rufibacter glacialis]GGK87011.1 LacI family transcriptional regulator [Rufibacter glacialis]